MASMPRSALQLLEADHIITLNEMPGLLIRLVQEES